HLKLRGNVAIQADLVSEANLEIDAEYSVLSDGTLVGLVQNAEAFYGGTGPEIFAANYELAAFARVINDQPFSLRLYQADETFIVKDLQISPKLGTGAGENASEMLGLLATYVPVALKGRWDAAPQAVGVPVQPARGAFAPAVSY
ncbi:MAG: hypothetical protein AAF907_16905, partial [Planctomycetota bacterium]